MGTAARAGAGGHAPSAQQKLLLAHGTSSQDHPRFFKLNSTGFCLSYLNFTDLCLHYLKNQIYIAYMMLM